MRLWEIEAALQAVPHFHAPRPELEQYITPPHLAAHLALALQNEHDLHCATVLDLGCGTGMLARAATLAGAAHVVGLDVDHEALQIASQTVPEADFVHADVLHLGASTAKCADVALTNPPFGTKRPGVDVAFLLAAINAARGVAFSMHKSSTRPYLEKRLRKWGVQAQVLATMRYELPKTYKFHSKHTMHIDVDLWRIECEGVDVITDTPSANVQKPIEQIGSYNVRDRSMQRRGRGGRRKGRR